MKFILQQAIRTKADTSLSKLCTVCNLEALTFPSLLPFLMQNAHIIQGSSMHLSTVFLSELPCCQYPTGTPLIPLHPYFFHEINSDRKLITPSSPPQLRRHRIPFPQLCLCVLSSSFLLLWSTASQTRPKPV